MRLPLGGYVCRWDGAFAVGKERLPLGRCVCRWRRTFAVGAVNSNAKAPTHLNGLRWVGSTRFINKQMFASGRRSVSCNRRLYVGLLGQRVWCRAARLPLEKCVCRWTGAFAVGQMRLPLGGCVCRWAGAFAVERVRLPLGPMDL